MKTHKNQNSQNLIESSRPFTTLPLLSCLLLLGLAASGLGAERDNLDQRIRNLSDRFEAMQAKPGKRISPEILRKAQGIILLDGTKAGLLFAYQHAGGVAMVKDSRTGEWGSASFLGANEASQGLQIGGERSLTVIVITKPDATWALVGPVTKFGGEASGTAGTATGKAEGVISPLEEPATVYSDSRGLFAGAAIKGGTIWPDTDANLAYYGLPLSAKEILFDGKVKPTAAAEELAKRISESSKQSAGQLNDAVADSR
jgi:lipid-binding SYLF domain-containing protein